MLEGINDGLQNWLKQAQKIEGAIDTTMVKAKALEGKIDITNKQLETSNKQLKDLVKKFGAPSKLCIDLVLIIILFGLGYLLIKMMK